MAESIWAIEADLRFSRAVTNFTREAGPDIDAGTLALPLAAFTDSSDFSDHNAGWSDWPPLQLEIIAGAQD